MFNQHPPYTPDLAPNDFHIFLYHKKLSGQRQRFQNDKEAEMSVTVVSTPGVRLLRNRIQNLVPRYDKYLNSGGEYVVKVAQHLLYLLQSQAADCYNTGIQKLVPRYDKCLNSGGEYVEK